LGDSIQWVSIERAARDPREQIAGGFRLFAREAGGRSPLYVEIAETVAANPWTLDFLAAMPQAKWQPNVLLAVVRYLFGTPGSGREFVALVRQRSDEVAATMAVRSTQTNEPARCATLLPVLARLPQPLALLEVGASAGLCLLPDYYAYDYGGRAVEPRESCGLDPPRFACRAGGGTPLPDRNVEVAWRAGLDLDPVDLRDDAEVRWLEALVWPGEEYRLPRLRAAIEVARAHPPRLVVGDLRRDLEALAAEAPKEATLVVYHTAVLAYVRQRQERADFARAVENLGAAWVANEGIEHLPDAPSEPFGRPARHDAFLLCVDRQPVAWVDSHGTWIEWQAR
jgi:hypothetical protein